MSTRTNRVGLLMGLFAALTFGIAACGGGGNGGNGGPSTGMCQTECQAASDCGNNADNWACEGGWCEADQCSEDADCVPTTSGWTNEGCSVDDCMQGKVCITHGDTTYCATQPVQDSCAIGEKITKSKADGSEEVDVCGDKSYSCNDGVCQQEGGGGCDSDDQCGDMVCKDGSCVCESDDQCPGDTVCNSGSCVCENDDQCKSVDESMACRM